MQAEGIECGMCGVAVQLDDDTKILVLSDIHALAYHPWCWDEVRERIVLLAHAEDLLLIDALEGGLTSTDAAGDAVPTGDAVDE